MKPVDMSDVPELFYPDAADVAFFTIGVLTAMAGQLQIAGCLNQRILGESLLTDDDGEQSARKVLLRIFARAMIAADTSPPDLKVID